MKTVTKIMAFDKVVALKHKKLAKPKKPSMFWRTLIKLISKPDLKASNFTYTTVDMEKLGKNEPCLILMNHSCFMDLEIAETLMYPRPLNIVCTSDGFVGKNFLMRSIGCIPTNKFVNDVALVRNIRYALTKLKSNVLMYPEASYSFDGTATPLPASLSKCIKLLNVPIIMIKTFGAFSRNPLYNNLQVRKSVNVSAEMKYLLSPEDIQTLSVEEIQNILTKEFTFDNFKWQQENNVIINDDFRADCLNRVLYKCPSCLKEGKLLGKGIRLICHNCNKEYELTENGFMKALDGKTEFDHIPTWFKWQRDEVKKEIDSGEYNLKVPVEICMMVDTKAIYKVGKGILQHTANGFVLDGCDGKLHYEQKPKASYSLYSDYYWYELGDIICIGDMKTLYYCFPQTEDDVVAKTRLATEELYKITVAK